MAGNSAVAWLFEHLQLLTTLVGIAAFLVSCIVKHASEGVAADSLARAATWCALPNGVAFLICSAYPACAAQLSDSSIAFLMGGLALVAVALCDAKTLFKSAP